jgi:hypothetical protein
MTNLLGRPINAVNVIVTEFNNRINY